MEWYKKYDKKESKVPQKVKYLPEEEELATFAYEMAECIYICNERKTGG